MNIVIRTDASLQIGTGHVMRCLTLATELKKSGAQVSFICREHKGHLIERIQAQGFDVHVLSNEYRPVDFDKNNSALFHAAWLGTTQLQDAQQCQPVLETLQPDWLIVDHYAIDQTWQACLKSTYKKLMVIDDLADRSHDCDLLLDQNYGSTSAKYQGCVPTHCTILAGANYALLRPEFAQWREVSLKRRKNKRNIESILVTMGGVDPDNYTGQILQQLKNVNLSEFKEIVVVVGATSPNLETIQKQISTMPIKTLVKTNVNNMAEIMANADLAIGAAGATTWERCCLGLPTIQMVIAENQRQIAEALANGGVVKLMDDIAQLPGLVETVNQWQTTMSLKAVQISDGLGCKRVVNELLECVK